MSYAHAAFFMGEMDMPDEQDTGVDQTQTETDLPDNDSEDISDIVEGFDEEEDTSEREEEEISTPTSEEEKSTEPSIEELQQSIANYKKQVSGLNRALHNERQAKKTEDQPDIDLTDDQIAGILEEHKDDPRTLMNVVKYIAEQQTKKGVKEAEDVQVVSRLKKVESDFLANDALSFLADENHPDTKMISNVVDGFRLGSHPAGRMLAIKYIMAEKIPEIQKTAYEKGKADAMGDKVEKTRKSEVDGKKPIQPKSGKKADVIKGASSEEKEVIKKLGLTGGAAKKYLEMRRNKKGAIMEA